MAQNNPPSPPMAEPGRRVQGTDVGGMAASADRGLADSLQRSQERGDDDAIGGVSTGEATAGSTPRVDLGGKQEPGSAAGAPAPSRRNPSEEAPTRRDGGDGAPGSIESDSPRTRDGGGGGLDTADPDGSSRPAHERDEPRGEGAIESLGRSISEVVTGSDEEVVENVAKRR